MKQFARFMLLTVGLLALSGALQAGEKKLMHCFLFTPVEAATDADWTAFYQATDGLPGKVPGLSRVWYGKLRSPFAFVNLTQQAAEARKELQGGAKTATGEVQRVVRSFGVCMEFNDLEALKVYSKHPAHAEWEKAYFKVREYGTNTFDIQGQ
ncbi:MAG TPA: hypothetical protein VN428_18375 [Bryobacteraceae bacterium]|nr:hypothetical protein [Bryobacteraceae bacterium]